MRTALFSIVAALALCAPLAAYADGTAPTPASNAAQNCKAQLAQMGAKTFGQAYKNFGACVSKATARAGQDVQNAAKSCKAEQADPGFAAAHGGKTFDQFYGANTNSKGKGNGSNAFGKCVSGKAQAAAEQHAAAATSAAKTCKAMLKSDAAAFATKYGKARNAFGKCVAAKGK
jgi:hypothetical protein